MAPTRNPSVLAQSPPSPREMPSKPCFSCVPTLKWVGSPLPSPNPPNDLKRSSVYCASYAIMMGVFAG